MRVIGVQTQLGNMLGQARDKVMFVPITFLKKVMSVERGDSRSWCARSAAWRGSTEMEDEVRTHPPLAAQDPLHAPTIRSASSAREAVQALWRSISQGAFAP